jgi:hypothetical protein
MRWYRSRPTRPATYRALTLSCPVRIHRLSVRLMAVEHVDGRLTSASAFGGCCQPIADHSYRRVPLIRLQPFSQRAQGVATAVGIPTCLVSLSPAVHNGLHLVRNGDALVDHLLDNRHHGNVLVSVGVMGPPRGSLRHHANSQSVASGPGPQPLVATATTNKPTRSIRRISTKAYAYLSDPVTTDNGM